MKKCHFLFAIIIICIIQTSVFSNGFENTEESSTMEGLIKTYLVEHLGSHYEIEYKGDINSDDLEEIVASLKANVADSIQGVEGGKFVDEVLIFQFDKNKPMPLLHIKGDRVVRQPDGVTILEKKVNFVWSFQMTKAQDAHTIRLTPVQIGGDSVWDTKLIVWNKAKKAYEIFAVP